MKDAPLHRDPRAASRNMASRDRNRIHPPYDDAEGRQVDRGIAREVKILFENGIETTESCEGGPGHPFPEPTVTFCGDQAQGFRALAIARQHGLKVSELRRVWTIIDGEPVGPEWDMTFYR
jgi:hypothetical protein